MDNDTEKTRLAIDGFIREEEKLLAKQIIPMIINEICFKFLYLEQKYIQCADPVCEAQITIESSGICDECKMVGCKSHLNPSGQGHICYHCEEIHTEEINHKMKMDGYGNPIESNSLYF
eukprot:196112_1